MNEYLSYAQFLKDRKEFRKSGTIHGEDFNLLDFPSHKFFKILFYFGSHNMDETDNDLSSGLLAPTWNTFNSELNKENNLNYYEFNSAWSYLKLNDENERAEKLEKFVNLLSNINSCSPWYFSSISGIDTALERKGPDSTDFNLSEPGKLTITCMPDAFDNRIGTLLELYRDITWSWQNKKEIIPANLRKFDMAIYFFESSVTNWYNDDNIIGSNSGDFRPSYKMIEFHDCEFSYNSIKSGWSEINNETGISPKYTIDISYNDCYETSYNEHIMRKIGDVIMTDTYAATIDESGNNVNRESFVSKSQVDSNKQIAELEKRLQTRTETTDQIRNNEQSTLGNLNETTDQIRNNEQSTLGNLNETRTDLVKKIIPKTGFIQNVAGQIIGTAIDFVEEKLTSAVLGNLYTYSLTKIGSQLSDVVKGNIIKTGQSVKQYIDNAQMREAAKIKNTTGNLGNLYKNTIVNN